MRDAGRAEKGYRPRRFDVRWVNSRSYFKPMGKHDAGKSYRDLRVWNTAISLALEVYRITESLPQDERFGLSAQLRRAVVSVASNIAEGHARSTRGEFKNFLSIARGSVAEVEVQLILAKELGYVASPVLAKALDHSDAISRMITNLKRAL
jgi:four helix bundle protein